ncbi:hypothetical protein CAPTEDRAFT_215262 [Capitella teleta]|uniref:Uncharacterized protein n=1 Tax=Capitella teleta TaxID=283909 RepID=R7VFT1_CAPTE|nr:hypothetical protein CAPTEDRAFT_215262 [Capitella teleta]|eukprot:ELU17484.1 hypothetical protein CAPTEDRAFT_215262 [Capitella teleta]
MQLPELFTCLCSVLLLGRGAHGLHDSHPVFSFRSWFLQDLSQALPKETASQEPSRGSESWPWSHNQVKLRLTESQNDEAEAPRSTQVDQLSDYIGISKRAASSVNSDYLHSDYQRRSAKTSLKEIAKKHPVSAVFEAIENTQKLGSNCTESGYRSLAVPFPKVTHKPFKYLTVSALKTANVLNNLFRTWDASPTLYNDAFFFAQVRSTLETDRDELIHGAAIAFEVGQYQGQNGEKHFCPYIYRAKNGALYSENVSNRQYAAKEAVGYDWFHDQRGQHFSNLVGHEAGICRSVSDSDPARRHNLSTVVTTDEQGLWRGPFYKCKGDKAWTLTYSVPFFGCTKNKTLQFK